MNSRLLSQSLIALFLLINLTGCVGTVIDAAVDTTIAIAKVPFKVGGAVVDVVKGDDEEEK
jgi:hypothetical protein